MREAVAKLVCWVRARRGRRWFSLFLGYLAVLLFTLYFLVFVIVIAKCLSGEEPSQTIAEVLKFEMRGLPLLPIVMGWPLARGWRVSIIELLTLTALIVLFLADLPANTESKRVVILAVMVVAVLGLAWRMSATPPDEV